MARNDPFRLVLAFERIPASLKTDGFTAPKLQHDITCESSRIAA